MYFLSSVRLGALPQGLFSAPKVHLLHFMNRESVVLCLKYITYLLSKLGATGCAPAGFFSPPKYHLLCFDNREYFVYIWLQYFVFLPNGHTEVQHVGFRYHVQMEVRGDARTGYFIPGFDWDGLVGGVARKLLHRRRRPR